MSQIITKHISAVEKGDAVIINNKVVIATSDAYLIDTDNGREWNFVSGEDYFYATDFIDGLVDTDASQKADDNKCRVPYVSVWDGGVEVETTAVVNIKTGEVTDIQVVDVRGLDICESEYILMCGEQVYVYSDEHGFEKWADIKNEYGG
jgi:hypothetical protein